MQTVSPAIQQSPPYPEPINLAGLKRLQLPASVLVRPDMARGMQDPILGAMLRLTVCSLQEVPAGSLPSDDYELRVLAGMARVSDEEWHRVRSSVLMTWRLCTDGRIYDFTLVEPVMAMWRQLEGSRMGARRSVESRRRVANAAA